MRNKILILLLCLITLPLHSAERFRAAWIATVANIDWPTAEAVDNEVLQREEMIFLLDSLRALHFNAIIFQVRPTADALYHSELEQRSRWVGAGEYDPLAFVLQEAHLRNMEVHVWVNPYRVTLKDHIVPDGHLYYQHPEWFFHYGGQWYMNPGLDETRDWICDVVEDIVCRYPVDAVHMDDYFYPYPVAGKELPDGHTFVTYPRGYTDIRDWRRNNVNMVIQELQQRIHETRPGCRFGISPFGVWRNDNVDPEWGSATRAGMTNYDDLYADILLWMREGWIDYVAPQIYWEIGKKVADYAVLARWWAEHSYGCELYIGLADYRLGSGKAGNPWREGNELMRQLRYNRQLDEIRGECFYSTRPLLRNPQHICDSLRVYRP